MTTRKPDPVVERPIYYAKGATTPTETLVEWAHEGLTGADFDTLVGTGLSGAAVVPRLAEALGVHWALVRKPNDGSHDGGPVVGNVGHRWLFVDDFVSSGETFDRAYAAIERFLLDHGAAGQSQYAGTWQYNAHEQEPGLDSYSRSLRRNAFQPGPEAPHHW